MNRDELLALADRVEAASGPNREMDLDIHHALQPRRYRWAEFGGLHEQDAIAVEEPPAFVAEMIEKKGHVARALWEPEIVLITRYTASLDAAMTLVPEGWLWATEAYPDHAEAIVRLPYDDGDEVRAATPALALVAAALRAKAGA